MTGTPQTPPLENATEPSRFKELVAGAAHPILGAAAYGAAIRFFEITTWAEAAGVACGASLFPILVMTRESKDKNGYSGVALVIASIFDKQAREVEKPTFWNAPANTAAFLAMTILGFPIASAIIGRPAWWGVPASLAFCVTFLMSGGYVFLSIFR